VCKIYNASHLSVLDVFPKVNYDCIVKELDDE
jgi:hypothetical protein